MKLKHLIISLVILFSQQGFAASNNSSKVGIDLGIAYDLDLGISAQYKQYTFFVNSDALAVDMRFQNFHNDSKSLHFYIDGGLFFEDHGNNTRDDSVGIRVPVGFTFGIERNIEVFVQAVPSFDFSDNDDFSIDGAAGVRYRF
jgi:hypothetical protein